MIGRLGRPHGLDGFLGLYIDESDVVIVQPGVTLFVGDVPRVVRAVRRVDRGYQVAFEDIDDRFLAEEIRGSDVYAEQRRDLGEGEFWPEDLIGLSVFDQDGARLGAVREVLFGPGQDRLLIDGDTGSVFEVPFVDDLVPVVDLGGARIEIVALPGLIEPQ